MNTDRFSWAKFSSPAYGDAGEVPAVLASARSARSDEEVTDLVEPILRFVQDAGVLNHAAGHMATALVEEVDAAFREGRAASSYLGILARLFESRAYLADIAGWPPHESITIPLHWTPAQKVQFVVEQRQHLARVQLAVSAHHELLRRIAARGFPGDRVRAVATLHLADCLSRRHDEDLLMNAAASLSIEGHIASLMLPCAALCVADEKTPMTSWLRAFLDSPSLYLQSAAWGALQTFGVARLSSGTHRALVKEYSELESLLAAADRLSADYVWHDGLLAGEFCRGVYRGDLTTDDKSSLLAKGLARRAESPNDLLVAPSVASTAAWFFLRLRLSTHYRRTTPLDPDALSDDERDAVQVLRATLRNWISLGADYPNAFGLWSFATTAAHLIEPSEGLAQRLSEPWPYESERSSVLGWLLRALSLPWQSVERGAAFDLVAQQLLHDFDDTRLANVLGDAQNLDGFASRELALPLLSRLIRRQYGETSDTAALGGDAMLEKLASAAAPELVTAIRRLLGP